MRSFFITALLAGLATHVSAQGVKVVTPAAGATVAASGPVTITVADSGVAPGLALLTGTAQVALMVGGNTDADSKQLAVVGAFTWPTLTTAVNIGPGLCGALANGFYFKIISNQQDGGTVINYSNRFSISGMVGTAVEQTYVTGAASAGSTVPVAAVAAAAAAAGNTAASGADQFTVPYNQQTGLTKYAPMQPVPPTKITKGGGASPLFPTSAYQLATTWLPKPSQLTTMTQQQTFSVESVENTAAAQSLPTGDMAKFLNRWKD